ncbi:sensor histidine kinase [Haloactinomyces albus]|uniref:histidine kinase n=1 Tax=Haloactinomyces albus TaxID=1352928 RepID=A0AAE3ZEE3_9ACTN|nr:histidine kinase [Haloactinomyces albus]MDR7302123.1 signal transduction histidine kinase [Haloactinomyces albus]
MRRLSLWMRAHPVAGDSAVAMLLLVPEVLIFLVDSAGTTTPVRYVLASALLVGPLALRRTMPIPAACTVLLGLLVQQLDQATMVTRPASLALEITLYTLVAYVGRKVAALYTAAVFVLSAVGTVQQATGFFEAGLAVALLFLLLQQGVQLAFCWVLGEFVGARRAYQAEVEHRLRSLEFEQDQQARIAVAEERNRIARELHDVLAHSVSVMVTQADGAAYALRSKPELAEQAVHTIGTTGREALTELRSLLQVLRNPQEETGRERSPQPSISAIESLVERVRALGLPIELELDGDLKNLPAGLGLGVYRIVQESLTNVLKHAGWKASASVRIGHDGQCVEIDVSDTGAKGILPPLASGGNGMVGMRERATAYGGSFEAGPRDGGGWRVHAALPLTGLPLSRSASAQGPLS